MPIAQAKLSSRYQLVIPRAVRKDLNLKPGMSVYVSAHDADTLHISRVKGWAKSMLGLGKEMWREAGGGDKYLKELRREWEDRAKRYKKELGLEI
ncbi:MAG: AbrB/MazE/SpoVT family DNA-binding domain-containing protein [Patescibacteria group bacterium]